MPWEPIYVKRYEKDFNYQFPKILINSNLILEATEKGFNFLSISKYSLCESFLDEYLWMCNIEWKLAVPGQVSLEMIGLLELAFSERLLTWRILITGNNMECFGKKKFTALYN